MCLVNFLSLGQTYVRLYVHIFCAELWSIQDPNKLWVLF